MTHFQSRKVLQGNCGLGINLKWSVQAKLAIPAVALDLSTSPCLKNSLLNLNGPISKTFKDRHGGLGRDSWLLHVNAYP